MDVITTSLEALIQRATNSKNQCPDVAAIDAFCGLVNREPDCVQMAARFITAKVHSLQEWEAVQALLVLDACMRKCGSNFHAEVGKFRFLNELIKVVSPKYLGAHTPEPVRNRVLELMYSWTQRYPKETKIKEAYEMLKKQGVVKDDRPISYELQPPVENTLNSVSSTVLSVVSPSRPTSSIFHDEEKSRLLQKLLQSKNPDDLQAANRLIKTMVKEDERRVEQKVRRTTELEAVHNNARLLSEMLDSYRPGISSAQDLELITELHTSCLRLRATVFKLASEVHSDESLFNEVLATNDELGDVFDKYTKIIKQDKQQVSTENNAGGSSLLDLSTPSEELLPPPVSLLNEQLADLGLDAMTSKDVNAINTSSANKTTQQYSLHQQPGLQQPANEQTRSDFTALGEIFSSSSTGPTLQPVSAINSGLSYSVKPGGTSSPNVNMNPSDQPEERSNKLKALEDLDILGATLLKENLPQAAKNNKVTSKVPMNQLNKLTESQPTSPTHNQLSVKSNESPENKSLDLLIGTLSDNAELQNEHSRDSSLISLTDSNCSTGNKALDNQIISDSSSSAAPRPTDDKDSSSADVNKKEQLVKPLGDVCITLESIKPGTLPPRTLLDEKNGISVILHISQSRPRSDVTVFVVTTTSKNTSPLTNYLFQPVVPKTCRLRLLPATATELPPHNPFLPPSIISQIMLIASSSQEPITLKFVVSYTMDEETMTEMGEASDIPLSVT